MADVLIIVLHWSEARAGVLGLGHNWSAVQRPVISHDYAELTLTRSHPPVAAVPSSWLSQNFTLRPFITGYRNPGCGSLCCYRSKGDQASALTVPASPPLAGAPKKDTKDTAKLLIPLMLLLWHFSSLYLCIWCSKTLVEWVDYDRRSLKVLGI